MLIRLLWIKYIYIYIYIYIYNILYFHCKLKHVMNIPRILPAHRQVSTRKEIQWTRSITPQLTVTQIYTCIQVHLHTNMIHEQLFQDEKKNKTLK